MQPQFVESLVEFVGYNEADEVANVVLTRVFEAIDVMLQCICEGTEVFVVAMLQRLAFDNT